jgi:hypothetical protein
MVLNNHDQAQIRQYLLGKLDDAEQEKIEERLMVEDDLFDEFEASKDELVEEYCAGDLDRPEREWFASHYLASPEGRERHAFALTIEHMRRRNPEPRTVVTVDRPSFFEWLRQIANVRPWAFGAAASVVLVLFVGYIAIRLIPPRQGQVFEATLTSTPAKRGDGEGPPRTILQVPANTDQLKLRLQLPKPAPAGTRYTAELDDRVNTSAVAVVGSDAQSVTVLIPRKQLPRNWYSVELITTPPSGNVQRLSYPFTVE